MRFLSALIAVGVLITALASCDLGIKHKTYAPTEADYFEFVLTGDDTYAVAAKEGVTLPAELNLPTEYDGVAVTAVVPEGFKNRSEIESLTVPENYVSVGNGAFMACDALKTVALYGVENLGYSAFDHCTALRKVTFSDNLKTVGGFAFAYTDIYVVRFITLETLGEYAFSHCEVVKNVYLPSSFKLENMGENAFVDCVNATVHHGNSNYVVEDGKLVLSGSAN